MKHYIMIVCSSIIQAINAAQSDEINSLKSENEDLESELNQHAGNIFSYRNSHENQDEIQDHIRTHSILRT